MCVFDVNSGVVFVTRRPGFLRKILNKKRPHKEAQTPDDGDLTMAQSLDEGN